MYGDVQLSAGHGGAQEKPTLWLLQEATAAKHDALLTQKLPAQL